MMGRKELKERIHELVEQVPDQFLESIRSYLEEIGKDSVVPDLGCTAAEYNQQLDEAMVRYGAGQSVPHEEAVRQINERLRQYEHED